MGRRRSWPGADPLGQGGQGLAMAGDAAGAGEARAWGSGRPHARAPLGGRGSVLPGRCPPSPLRPPQALCDWPLPYARSASSVSLKPVSGGEDAGDASPVCEQTSDSPPSSETCRSGPDTVERVVPEPPAPPLPETGLPGEAGAPPTPAGEEAGRRPTQTGHARRTGVGTALTG